MIDTITNENESMSKRKQGRRGNGFGGLTLRGNTYYARFRDALGNPREVSTHTSNRDEALKILATYTAPIRESKSQEEIKLRLQQSIDVLELRKDVAKVEKLKLDELAAKFLNHRNLADTTDGTKAIYKAQIEKLIAAIHTINPNAKYIDDVTIDVADSAMGELTKQYTPATYNLALATYRRAWSMFSRSNPFSKITKRKIDKSRHRQVVSEDDIRRIFDSCRDDLERAVWGVGIYTGLRISDVSNLNYGALSRDLGTITWLPQKTKRHMSAPLVIPICPTLKTLLLKVLDFRKIGNDDFKGDLLWPDYQRRHKNNEAQGWFRVTLEKAGLKTSTKDEDGRRQVLTGFHITRLAFVSFASKHMSPLLVSKIVGHSSLEMTEHYCQNNQDALRDGLSQMPNFTAQKIEVKSEADEIMGILNSMKRDGESKMDCLKRLIEGSVKMAS